jgi:CSLREA domain-containing protein
MLTTNTNLLRRFSLSALLSLTSAICLPVNAATFHVTTTADTYDGICDSDCSLRDAINTGNQVNEEHLIYLKAKTYAFSRPRTELDPGVYPREYLDEDDNSLGDLDIKSRFTILGSKTGETIINANQLDRHFSVSANSALILNNLTLINGKSAQEGGAVLNKGIVWLNTVSAENNLVTAAEHSVSGGAISNYGNLEVRRSRFIGNKIYAKDFNQSFGGAIYNNGSLYMRDSELRRNESGTDESISYGGAIYNKAQADISRSLFTENYTQAVGSAIYNYDEAEIKISNSTLSNNRSDHYGMAAALVNIGKLTLVNASIVNNLHSGGLINYGPAIIRNSIIINNFYTIYRNNQDMPRNCDNYARAAIFKVRGLLVGDGNMKCTGDIHIADSETFTRVLAPLAQNNYHLETHALLPNSPAIDAGVGSCSAHDQRWQSRPVDGNDDGVAGCDLGAFELQVND